jgi:hypothetical protein
MYNIYFEVKYHDIEGELLDKLKNKINDITSNGVEEYDESVEESVEEYTSQDIRDICEKLYKDELLSVFHANSIDDEIILQTMKDILELMLQNDKFEKSLHEIKTHIIHDGSTPNHATTEFIFFTMFAYQTFHITHKCICDMLSSGTIDDELLRQFTQCGIEMFNSQS